MTCPSCGADVPNGSRFCPSCGHSIVARPDERRIATVLFADVVGFTAFSEQADPEQVKTLVDRLFERLAADITAYGGVVDKIVGDAVVALFGAPIAHEDDPERAVRTALAMQESAACFGTEHEVDLRLRIGVNTGEVLVGGIRAGDDYTAMGDVVNSASRLQTTAAPGQVLVGADTHHATKAIVRYEEAGDLDVKGRSEPIAAWVAVEATAPPGHRRELGHAPLIGRDAERAILDQVLEGARQRKRSQFILILGEAGVGKSRLAFEALGAAQRHRGTTVLEGQCVPYGETNRWWPIAEAMRDACGIDPADPRDVAFDAASAAVAKATGRAVDDPETRRVAEGLGFLMGWAEMPDAVDPGRAREEALRSVLVYLEALATAGPVVVLLSDVHWADDAVLEHVGSLLTRLRGVPFTLVATARPELSDRWTLPVGRYDALTLHLDPLDNTATRALIRDRLGSTTPDAVVDLLLERSGGNPFFIEELAALISESDMDATAVADAGARVRALPATLRGLVAARLDGLDAETRQVLEDAAVAGSTGPVDLLRALAGDAADQVTQCLAQLTERDLLRLDDGDWLFPSELVRDLAYGTLAKAERARRHAAVGAWLEEYARTRERDDELAELVALHYGKATDLVAELPAVDGLPDDLDERAAHAFANAAHAAERTESWQRAERNYDQLIRLAADDRGTALARLGRARALVGRFQAATAREDVDAVIDFARATGDETLSAQAQLVLGELLMRTNEFEPADAAFLEAIAAFDARGDRAGGAEARRSRGMGNLFRGEQAIAETDIRAALQTFRDLGDRRGEAWALQNLAWIAFTLGLSDEAERRAHESADAFAQVGDWGGLGWALGILAWVRFNQGHLDEAEQLALSVLGDAEDTGNDWATGMMDVLLADIALWSGRGELAVERGRAALEHFQQIDESWAMLQALVPIVRALAYLGRFGEADAILDDPTTIANLGDLRQFGFAALAHLLRASVFVHRGDGPALPDDVTDLLRQELAGEGIPAEETRASLGYVLLQSGKIDPAVELLETAYRKAVNDSYAGASGPGFALALAAAGRVDEALEVTDRLADLEVGSYLDRLQAWEARTVLLAAAGDAAGAREAADRAVGLADDTDSRLDQAIARLARAIAFEALGEADAADARRDAGTRLAGMGIDAAGWETAFGLAARGNLVAS